LIVGSAVPINSQPMTDDRRQQVERNREYVSEQLSKASSRISELARPIGFGLTALIYVFATSDSNFAKAAMHAHSYWIGALSITGCVVLVLDYVQYLMAYEDSLDALKRINNMPDGPYVDSVKYWIRDLAFKVKQLVAIGGTIAFGVFLVIMIFVQPPTVADSCAKHGPPCTSADCASEQTSCINFAAEHK
jgi:hypothetical protein